MDHAGPASDEDTGAVADSNAGREHYQAVGYVFCRRFSFSPFLCAFAIVLIFGRKGKLRKPEPIALGKQYAGSRVSRDALEAGSDDEPFQSHSSDDEEGLEKSGQADDSDEVGDSSEEADDVDMEDPSSLPRPNNAADEGKGQGVADSSTRVQRGKAAKEGVGHHEDKRKSHSGHAQVYGDVDDREHIQPVEHAHKPARTLDRKRAKIFEGEADARGLRVAENNDSLGQQGEGQGSRHHARFRKEDNQSERDDGAIRPVLDDSHRQSDEEEPDGHASSMREEHGGIDERHDGGDGLDEREELRRLLSSDQRTIAAEISKAARGDAEKGRAVRKQQSTFDALLNTRIKIQKGLGAANHLAFTGQSADHADSNAIKSAESAALTLWSTLENLRLAMTSAQSGDESRKRKRPSPVSSTASTASLWKRMADLESESVAHRRAILDKWSLKVRGSSATVPNARGKLLGSSTGGQQNISAILDAQVASDIGERNAKRARRDTGGQDSSAPVYDDTAFYQSLLRSLVEQRISSDPVTNGLDNLHIQLPSRLSVHPVTGMRKDKVKRDIDTRASKGRKMKYNVHEKLQNFMAPEDRGAWTDRAREEFFASLLGKTASGLLGEGNDDATAESEEDVEEGGLRLFRS